MVVIDTNAFLKFLGAQIKTLREERGWSYRSMRTTHGWDDAQWRRYERGSNLNVGTLVKVAALFEMPLTTLLDGLGRYPASELPEIPEKKISAKSKSVATSKAAAVKAVAKSATKSAVKKPRTKKVLV